MNKQYDSILGGTPIDPMLPYADVWKREALDSVRMKAYRGLEAENQLHIEKITYNKDQGVVVIEYKTTIPHEWILEELKKRVKAAEKHVDTEQLSFA